MDGCMCCGQTAQYTFQALEVHTIHLRELSGERRIQGLGALRQCVVCRDCAEKYLNTVLRPHRLLLRRGMPFAAILVLGVLMLGVLRFSSRPVQMFGATAVICGVLGIASAIRTVLQKRRNYSRLPQETALEQAGWDCVLSVLPKKEQDADVTYIPVTKETLAMGTEELGLRFELLPPIAKEAAERIGKIE